MEGRGCGGGRLGTAAAFCPGQARAAAGRREAAPHRSRAEVGERSRMRDGREEKAKGAAWEGGKEGEQKQESMAWYKGGRDAARRGGKEVVVGVGEEREASPTPFWPRLSGFSFE